jgi:large subunit ribosomal protein L21
MYAVIETGGKQYRVAPGASIEIETLTGDVGSEVEFNRVLALVDGDSVKTGEGIGSALVKATITEHGRTQKNTGVQVQTQEAV